MLALIEGGAAKLLCCVVTVVCSTQDDVLSDIICRWSFLGVLPFQIGRPECTAPVAVHNKFFYQKLFFIFNGIRAERECWKMFTVLQVAVATVVHIRISDIFRFGYFR